jgi:hypothetical protein
MNQPRFTVYFSRKANQPDEEFWDTFMKNKLPEPKIMASDEFYAFLLQHKDGRVVIACPGWGEAYPDHRKFFPQGLCIELWQNIHKPSGMLLISCIVQDLAFASPAAAQ